MGLRKPPVVPGVAVPSVVPIGELLTSPESPSGEVIIPVPKSGGVDPTVESPVPVLFRAGVSPIGEIEEGDWNGKSPRPLEAAEPTAPAAAPARAGLRKPPATAGIVEPIGAAPTSPARPEGLVIIPVPRAASAAAPNVPAPDPAAVPAVEPAAAEPAVEPNHEIVLEIPVPSPAVTPASKPALAIGAKFF